MGSLSEDPTFRMHSAIQAETSGVERSLILRIEELERRIEIIERLQDAEITEHS